ncbi:MAG TPA: hypothetical protein VGF46_11450 [Gaiellales bacterium]|jgi:hypothetical protein
MNVESALRETVRLSSHLLLARREGELLGDPVDPDPSSEHLLRAALWSGEIYGLGDETARRALLSRLDELRASTTEEPWTLRELLDVAYPAALDLGDRHLGFEHILLAWTEEPAGPVHALVDENGLRAQMLEAVAAMRPDVTPRP